MFSEIIGACGAFQVVYFQTPLKQFKRDGNYVFAEKIARKLRFYKRLAGTILIDSFTITAVGVNLEVSVPIYRTANPPDAWALDVLFRVGWM